MGSMSLLLHGVDARTKTHIPPHLPMAPYAVLRTKIPFTFQTSTTEATTFLFSEWLGAGAAASLGTVGDKIAAWGLTSTATGSANTILDATITQIGTLKAYLRLHALTVTIQAGSGANSSVGFFYAGTMAGNVLLPSYATFGLMALDLYARRELRAHSAYESLGKPVVLCSAPQDMTSWATHDQLVLPAASSAMSDNLLPITAIFPATASPVDYMITINCEWRAVFTMTDARSSLHESRGTSSASSVAGLTRTVVESSGLLSGPDEAVRGSGSILGALASTAGAAASAALGYNVGTGRIVTRRFRRPEPTFFGMV